MDILDDFKKEPKVEYYKYKNPVAEKDALPEDQRKRLTHLVGQRMGRIITLNEYYKRLSTFWMDNGEEEFANEILLKVKH